MRWKGVHSPFLRVDWSLGSRAEASKQLSQTRHLLSRKRAGSAGRQASEAISRGCGPRRVHVCHKPRAMAGRASMICSVVTMVKTPSTTGDDPPPVREGHSSHSHAGSASRPCVRRWAVLIWEVQNGWLAFVAQTAEPPVSTCGCSPAPLLRTKAAAWLARIRNGERRPAHRAIR